uniref:PARP catalytic domain-containing protein n=1 Tax=Plectus sambesii TaxID=2011161 RepID=A0A914UPM0_9BILA
VLDKYGENDWLGGNGIRTTSARGEWPVAYHGTHEMNVKNIATDGLRLANGKRFLFGKGIYCTPDPKTALQYGHEFEHENGKWKLILQLRVRPDKIKKIAASRTPVGCGEYWVMPDDSCLRLYGICVYKVPSPVPDD